MTRSRKSIGFAAAVLTAATLVATSIVGTTAAQAKPPGWGHGGAPGWGHGAPGWGHGAPGWGHPYHRGPVVIVRPGFYYPPPPVYYAPPPPVYYAPPPPPPVYYAPAPVAVVPGGYICQDNGSAAALGAAAGGTAGAIIGATTTHGHTRWAATAGGAILGVLLGGTIGSAVDVADSNCAAQAVAYGPIGTPVQWANPGYGVQYQVMPVRQFANGGQVCREYQANAAINGGWQQVHGTACLQPDGSWQIVN